MGEATEDGDYGFGYYPGRSAPKKKTSSLAKSLLTFNSSCRTMLLVALNRSPHAKLLLNAMDSSGCKVLKERHFSCEDCDGSVSGGFDTTTSQIVLCQNNIRQQAHMNRVVVHELIHAFDHCRANVDWFNNYRHLACSEIRAASLSGDCSFPNELGKLNFAVKKHHQECVRYRAVGSILAVRKIKREDAGKIVNEVFNFCYNDRAPFGRIPHCKRDAEFAFRDYENRHRYYNNL